MGAPWGDTSLCRRSLASVGVESIDGVTVATKASVDVKPGFVVEGVQLFGAWETGWESVRSTITGERGGRVASISPSKIDTISWTRASGSDDGFVSKMTAKSLAILS